MMRLIFSDHLIESRRDRDLSEADVTLQKKFYKNMLSNGIFVNNNGILFLSTEHSNDDIEKIISSIILSTPILTA